MEGRSWFFAKWPTWLRWLLFIPVSLLGGIGVSLLCRIVIATPIALIDEIIGALLGPQFSIHQIVLDVLFSNCVCYAAYLAVPSKKYFISGIYMVVFVIISLVMVAVHFVRGMAIGADMVRSFISGVILCVEAVFCFTYSGKSETIITSARAIAE